MRELKKRYAAVGDAGLSTIVLGEADLAQIVRTIGLDALMDELIDALEGSLREHDPMHVEVRKRDGFVYAEPHPGVFEWMPVMESGDHVVVKLVGYNPSNVDERCLPTILSTMGLYDVRSGHLRALCDGTFPTALRTGAASAVASRVLARSDSAVLGLVGCGAQSVTQLHALSRVFHLRRVLIYDVLPSSVRSFRRRTAFLDIDIVPASLAQVEREVDILCTATSVEIGAGPVICGTSLKPHVHLNAVGSDLPGKIELPRQLLQRALVCPDFLPQAVVEGECQQLQAGEIGPSLVELVKAPERFRAYRDEVTVFDSTGFALEDKVAFELILQHAERLGIGRRIQVETTSTDPRDPYGFIYADDLLLRAPDTIRRASDGECDHGPGPVG
ncbi:MULTISPECIES: ornithine cyclodeaminase family protein [Sorangium]|uniref:Ornithine cyclodeaminase n=1 Tax=Sorangium cellulosum TaxID=56 RepID=A0A4P2R6W1_SORCE|nr:MULTISPECIES: ornithine cyclodeaminase family protein [Sorangium]AUX38588.1 ornithine cyclodeaminase [Sorangium cellulosum]WCQ97872.1 L-lysine cyclodeaminase [Sorangium sp. Soce836]